MIYTIIGFFAGVIGGMGMGGGTLLIPLLTIGLSVPQQTAQFINLVAFIPMSALALIVHIRNGYVVKKRIFYVIVPALVFAVAGSFIATVVSAAILKKAFGGFLILLGAVYFFGSIFTRKSAK